MKGARLAVAAGVALLALVVWKRELFTPAAAGPPRPLVAVAAATRRAVAVDVALPAVPIGIQRLRAGDGVLLVHYWAPWERDSAPQAAALDSLRRLPGLEHVRIAVVCCDPFPSVARWVGRHRLRLPVLLDGPGLLRRTLPCPAMPFTYVLDARGRVAVRQPGEVDWLAPATRDVLMRLAGEASAAGAQGTTTSLRLSRTPPVSSSAT